MPEVEETHDGELHTYAQQGQKLRRPLGRLARSCGGLLITAAATTALCCAPLAAVGVGNNIHITNFQGRQFTAVEAARDPSLLLDTIGQVTNIPGGSVTVRFDSHGVLDDVPISDGFIITNNGNGFEFTPEKGVG